MQENEIKALLQKYHQGQCSPEEVAFLESWYAQWNQQIPLALSAEELEADLKTISSHLFAQPAKVTKLWPRIAAAASILLVLSVGTYYLTHKPAPAQQTAQNQIPDVLPGSKKATLQLSNGKLISLSDAQKGTIAKQGNTNITKTADGQIVYSNDNTNNNTPSTEIVYNTITTKRGGYYPLKMADGTVAILDAASSIKYPVNFTGKERRVEITGQVYFEVVHNANQPFKVTVKGQTIEDLGTHFNINAYDDEANIVTTLVEGSVKINKQQQSATLKPGQEALSSNNTNSNNKIIVRKANIQQAIAWKEGKFNFEQTDLKTVMRQVSRWYDLDVTYQGNIANDEFDGQIPRDVKLTQFLKILASNQIHFEINNNGTNKTLIIKP